MPENLNPEAIAASNEAVRDLLDGPGTVTDDMIARAAVSAYLAHAQPIEDALGTYVMGTAEEAERSYQRRLTMHAHSVVSTVEELSRLPHLTTVVDATDTVRSLIGDCCGDLMWADVYGEDGVITLPATVLWVPTNG